MVYSGPETAVYQSIQRIATAVVVVAAVAEGAAFLGFRLVVEDRLAVHWRVDPARDVAAIPAADLQRFGEQFFDAELGWAFGPHTTAVPEATFDAAGARFDPVELPDGGAAAYGDSFTFGEGVGGDETWPHYLSERLGARVDNFGVAGYGPDQALLRLRRHLASGRPVPDTVVLGMLSENIARLVNVWRHMYVGSGELLNFKPRLIAGEGGPRWVDSPLPALTGIAAVHAAVAEAEAADDWFAYNRLRPRPAFPYIWAALDTAHYLAFRVRRWPDLWSMEAPVAVLDALVGEFVQLSRQYRFRPVLLMIPMGQDLRARDRGDPASYAAAVAALRARFADELVVVDVLDHDFESARFNQRPYAGHGSPYGNRMIAEAVADALERLP